MALKRSQTAPGGDEVNREKSEPPMDGSMYHITRIRPPEASLTEQIVGVEERHALYEQIVSSTGPLPERLQRADPRKRLHIVPVVATIASIAIALLSIAGSVTRPLGTSVQGIPTTRSGSNESLTLDMVAHHTLQAVDNASELDLHLDIQLTLQQGIADPSRVEYLQAARGDQTRINEFGPEGSLERAVFVGKLDDVVVHRSIDYRKRTWTEQIQEVIDPDVPGDERGIVLAIGGSKTAAVTFSWLTSPAAIKQMLISDRMELNDQSDQGLIKVSGDVAKLDGLGDVASRLPTITQGARVEFWINPHTYLPMKTRVTTADGTTSSAAVRWIAPEQSNERFIPEVPYGFDRT